MNTVCIERFCTWFAYHLSNFQFRWSWEDWSDSLIGDKEMPQAKFIRETLHKCIRLSYHQVSQSWKIVVPFGSFFVFDFTSLLFFPFQRIAELVPHAAYQPLLPEKSAPDFKYHLDKNGDLPGHKVAQKAVSSVRAKCSSADLLAILNELPGCVPAEIVSELMIYYHSFYHCHVAMLVQIGFNLTYLLPSKKWGRGCGRRRRDSQCSSYQRLGPHFAQFGCQVLLPFLRRHRQVSFDFQGPRRG